MECKYTSQSRWPWGYIYGIVLYKTQHQTTHGYNRCNVPPFQDFMEFPMEPQITEKLDWQEMLSAWWAGAWDGRRRILTLPEEAELRAGNCLHPWTPAIEDRHERALGLSRTILKELFHEERHLIARIHTEAFAVVREFNANVGTVSPAAFGRLSQALGDWGSVTRAAMGRAQVAAHPHDLWVARYFRTLSANHKGLRRRRPRHLDEWKPRKASTVVKEFWSDPWNLLTGRKEFGYDAGDSAGVIDKAIKIINPDLKPDPGTQEDPHDRP